MYMSDNKKIVCMICSKNAHSIKVHIKEDHFAGSKQPYTFEKYVEKYPEAPLLTSAAVEYMKKMRAERVKSPKPTIFKYNLDENKKPMAELFGLSDANGKNISGKDIMIGVSDEIKFPEYVPQIDSSYVYPVTTLKTVLMALSQNIPVYIYGHAGVGKTSLFEQICARTNNRMIRIQHTANIEESHIIGQWTVEKFKDEESGQLISETVFKLGPLAVAMKYGFYYLADEFDRGHPTVMSIYNAVLEGKPLIIPEADEDNRVITPHKNFRFVANGNSNGSGDETGLYQATIMQDAASIERFGVCLKLNYMSPAKELKMIIDKTGLPSEDAERVVSFCTKIRESYPSSVSLTIGPRVAITAAVIGLLSGNIKRGIECAYANRLPESERESALAISQRIFG